eukprot:1392067-Amphidinium_carterae.1
MLWNILAKNFGSSPSGSTKLVTIVVHVSCSEFVIASSVFRIHAATKIRGGNRQQHQNGPKPSGYHTNCLWPFLIKSRCCDDKNS